MNFTIPFFPFSTVLPYTQYLYWVLVLFFSLSLSSPIDRQIFAFYILRIVRRYNAKEELQIIECGQATDMIEAMEWNFDVSGFSYHYLCYIDFIDFIQIKCHVIWQHIGVQSRIPACAFRLVTARVDLFFQFWQFKIVVDISS